MHVIFKITDKSEIYYITFTNRFINEKCNAIQ